ncbi:transposase [Streptomyces vinaceus]|uniref:transposase n=1 Tax=Streptomyces vinaceus TaxID=1960 RepID=UPI0038115A60
MFIMESKKPRPRARSRRSSRQRSSSCADGGDRSVGQVAKELGLTETAVRDWVRQAEIAKGERDGLTSSEREELAALRQENRRLREDVDILRRATSLFATETR